MSRYTMRRTGLSERDNDYVFRVDGKDAGRCYWTLVSGGRSGWLWTVYGTSKGGVEDTLAEAQVRFKDTWEG